MRYDRTYPIRQPDETEEAYAERLNAYREKRALAMRKAQETKAANRARKSAAAALQAVSHLSEMGHEDGADGEDATAPNDNMAERLEVLTASVAYLTQELRLIDRVVATAMRSSQDPVTRDRLSTIRWRIHKALSEDLTVSR